MSNTYEVAGFKPGVFVAGANLTAKQFHSVSVATDGDIEASGAGQLSAGILHNKPIDQEAVEMEMDGISKAVAGAAIASAGLKLMSNAAGRLITATSGNHVAAVSLTPAAGDGEFLAVKVVGHSGALLA